MTPPMAWKVKITNNYVNAADTDISVRFNAVRMRLETIEFFQMLHDKRPLQTVRYDLTPAQKAEQEARIKEFNLPF